MRRVPWLVAALALGQVACFTAFDILDYPVCIPGRTKLCGCEGGETTVCGADGDRWEPCVCGLSRGLVEGTIRLSAGEPFTRSQMVSIELQLTAMGSAMLSAMQFSNDGIMFSELVPYAELEPAWTLAAGDGQKIVYARVFDSQGAGGEFTATIVLDTIAPSGSLTLAEGAAFTASATVVAAVLAGDAGSGLAELSLSNDGTTFVPVVPGLTSWTLPQSDGPHTVILRLNDLAGNTSDLLADVVLDTTAPIPQNVMAIGGHRHVRLLWDALEVGSGIAGYEVGVASVPTGPFTFSPMQAAPDAIVEPLANLPIDGSATYYFVIRATDNVGHTGESPPVNERARYPFEHSLRVPGEQLNAVWVGSDAAIAAGVHGLVVRSEGSSPFQSLTRADPMTDETLYGIAEIRPGHHVAVGANGTVLRTLDKGLSWTAETSPTTETLYAVALVGESGNERYWVAVGAGGTIIRGVAGATPGPSTISLGSSGISDTLYAVAKCGDCDAAVAVGANGKILRGISNGLYWSGVAVPPYGTNTLRAVAAYGSTFIAGGNRATLPFIGSDDGGLTWEDYQNAAFDGMDVHALAPPMVDRFHAGGIHAGKTLVIALDPDLMNPTFFGQYDHSTLPKNAQGIVRALATTSANVTWVGDNGQISFTTSGADWTDRWSTPSTGSINSVAIDPAGSVWAVGTLYPPSFVPYAVRGSAYGTPGNWDTDTLTPGGAIWELKSVVAPEAGVAFVVGSGGFIAKYQDGAPGVWTQHSSSDGFGDNYHAVCCESGSSCMAVGNLEQIVQYDGSTTWQEIGTNGVRHLFGCTHFRDFGGISRFIAVGTDAHIEVGGNGFVEMKAQLSGVFTDFYDVASRPDAHVAIAVGTGGAMYRSVDFWHDDAAIGTWTPLDSPTSDELRSITFSTATSTWYVAGGDGLVYRSTNDGESWTQAVTHTSIPFQSIAVRHNGPFEYLLVGAGSLFIPATTAVLSSRFGGR